MNTSNSTMIRNRLAIAALTGALVASGAAVAWSGDLGKKAGPHATIIVPLDENSVDRDSLPHGSYAPVVKKVAPAVVKIEVTTTVKKASQEGMPDLNDPMFQQF